MRSSFPGVAAALLLAHLPGGSVSGALVGIAVGLAMGLPLYWLRAMGAGDVKLMGMVGAFLGGADTFAATLVIFVVGGVLGLVAVARRRAFGQLGANLKQMAFGGLVNTMTSAGPAIDARAAPSAFSHTGSRSPRERFSISHWRREGSSSESTLVPGTVLCTSCSGTQAAPPRQTCSVNTQYRGHPHKCRFRPSRSRAESVRSSTPRRSGFRPRRRPSRKPGSIRRSWWNWPPRSCSFVASRRWPTCATSCACPPRCSRACWLSCGPSVSSKSCGAGPPKATSTTS